MMKKKLLILFCIVIVIGITFVGLGFLLSRGIQVNEHQIDEDFEIKIAHITDTHFDNDFDSNDYSKLVDTINSSDIEVLLFTGDLFQERSISLEVETKIIEMLTALNADYKLAVLGNHDYDEYSTVRADVMRVLENSGFTVLVNESVELDINNRTFKFLGFDDLWNGDSNYTEILKEIDESAINFILAHEPDTFNEVKDLNFHTMYSGHSHGGQIRLPIIGDLINVPGARIYNEHHYRENDKDLYVSFGLGESAIRIRFYNRRQFEIYDFS